MARTPKPVDPTKALRKLLKLVRNGDADEEAGVVAELTAVLDASPAAITTLDGLRFLPHAAQMRRLDVVELLLARGADPRVKASDDGYPCIAALIGAPDSARVIALLERMVARGADPNERSGRTSALEQAADVGLAETDALLRLGASEAAALAALHIAVPAAVRDPERAAIVERLLAHLASVDAPGEEGLSALHVVAVHGTPELLAPVLARSGDLGHKVTVASEFNVGACSPPGGGLVPQVRFARGCTARDLVAAVLEVHEAAIAWYGATGYEGPERLERHAQLTAVLALLSARGVPHGAPERGEMPPFVAEVDALLARLAAHVGGDPEALRRTAAAAPIEDTGPWSYSSVILERARTSLLRGAVAAHTGDSWLAHIVAGDHRRFLVARQEQHGWKPPQPENYPEAARRPLANGVVVGGRGETLLLVWRHAEGVGRIGAAAPDSFVVLGDDILDFLRRELRALGVAVDDIATGPVKGPGTGFGPQVLRADRETPPGPEDIDRIGGLPRGVREWPEFDGKPMHHVLTLDLREHPYHCPPGVRALALFISSPMEHEAYAPHNDHTRVLLLTDADLERGEHPLPAALVGVETVAPASVRRENAAGMGERELYKHSFIGGDPIWLQGDESDDIEYDEDDDGGDGARPPHSFVLQFDESFISELNLGDMGIMYVFTDTAWFQCH
ncbi:ankyrin repeat domain-containing protein [Nannocystis pusilla]|uniref:ankyrin repeat domain-containing protein n=1 Tax=Nannocystis pusilla TaxID=889268 RepID=UPI003BF33E36